MCVRMETTQQKVEHRCRYCDKIFQRESSLTVHLCEPKRRYQEQTEVGVQIGLQSYLKFFEITQGSARLKTFDDFAVSPYYRAFVRFGRYCQNTRVINVPRFIEWLLKNNKKLDHWCRDTIYTEYLMQYLRVESVSDALTRAIERAMTWAEETHNPMRDYLRYGNSNQLCFAVTTGHLSPWVVYNCDSGQEFLDSLNSEQIAMIWCYIDADYWQRKFVDYPADQQYAREILTQAGW